MPPPQPSLPQQVEELRARVEALEKRIRELCDQAKQTRCSQGH